jgi:hypothetical protein
MQLYFTIEKNCDIIPQFYNITYFGSKHEDPCLQVLWFKFVFKKRWRS